MSDPKWREHWGDFESILKKRLDAGHKEYGDGVFDRDLVELLGEIEEELLDCIGWPFIAWVRIQDMKKQAVEADYIRKLENLLKDIAGNDWVVAHPVVEEIQALFKDD